MKRITKAYISIVSARFAIASFRIRRLLPKLFEVSTTVLQEIFGLAAPTDRLIQDRCLEYKGCNVHWGLSLETVCDKR